jgi:acylphosphatase
MRRHVNIRIKGKVQGVFFRASARDKATTLRVSGFARNEDDGSVYIEAEGAMEDIDAFIAWCKKGPERAIVTEWVVEEGPLKDMNEFIIQR